MRHRPHLLVEGPWPDAEIVVSDEATRHLRKVLRYPAGDPVTYTDGAGALGAGTWEGSMIRRGPEKMVPRIEPSVTLAVAPPRSKERQRSIVEKSQELGVERLVWLSTDHGQVRAPSNARAAAWARGALEQSRGAWLASLDEASLPDVPDAILLDADAQISLTSLSFDASVTLAIGPEGGFSDTEIESAQVLASLPTNILRTDTAAIAAIATVLAISA